MIKLFEEYNEYYYEMKEGEMDVIEDDEDFNFILFDQDEINKLRTYFNNCSLDLVSNNLIIEMRYAKFLASYSKQIKWSVYIYKCPDEWYICYCDKKYYKCDQMEGLIKLIEDLYD